MSLFVAEVIQTTSVQQKVSLLRCSGRVVWETVINLVSRLVIRKCWKSCKVTRWSPAVHVGMLDFFSTSVYSKNPNFLVVTCQKKRFASLCLPWSNLLRRNTPCKNSTDVNLNNGGNTINGTHSLLFKRHHRAGALHLQLGSTDDWKISPPRCDVNKLTRGSSVRPHEAFNTTRFKTPRVWVDVWRDDWSFTCCWTWICHFYTNRNDILKNIIQDVYVHS